MVHDSSSSSSNKNKNNNGNGMDKSHRTAHALLLIKNKIKSESHHPFIDFFN